MIASIKKTAFHRDVYEPAEDSFALVDALAAHREAWRLRPPRLCLEVGCGSGYVVTSLALLLAGAGGAGAGGGGAGGAQLLATDLSPAAAAASAATLEAHQVRQRVDLLLCDLAAPLSLGRLAGAVDLLVCNPPYVPTPDDEVHRGGVAAAWAGGARGRSAVTDRLLRLAPTLLSPGGGEMFLVTVHENDPEGIMREMEAAGLRARVALRRKADEEVLTILHFTRVGGGGGIGGGGGGEGGGGG